MTEKNHFFSSITKYFTLLFGKPSWQSPKWLSYVCQNITHFYRTQKLLAISLFILLIAAIGGYYWYQFLPKPEQISAVITPPAITPIAEKLEPLPLTIRFGLEQTKQLQPVSVAPLENVGKPVTAGIQISPALPGKWQWENDNQLNFYPAQDWPAGKTFHIKFSKDFFAKQIKLADDEYSFSTANFSVTIGDLKFYQDIKNPKKTQIVATLNFNFPVNPESLQKHTKLILQELKNNKLNLQAQTFTVNFSYDEHKRTAYLKSENIDLPAAPRFAELLISKGVVAENGSAKTQVLESGKVLIPDVGSFLRIEKVNTMIAHDNKNRPQQLLMLETSLGVPNEQLQRYISVYLLPKDRPATTSQPIQKNYDWHIPGEVTSDILTLAKPVAIEALPEDHDYPTSHGWKFNADSPGYLYIKLNRGVRGLGDFSLTHDYQTIVPVPTLPQEINFLHKGALISLSGEKKLTVLVRGIPLVKFSIARVLPTEINHLVSQTGGNFENPVFLNAQFGRNDLSEIFDEKREFNITKPADLQYATLDLEHYLPNKKTNSKTLGLFLIRGQGWDKDTDTPTNIENNRLILITDMGLLVKNNADNTHDIFVQSISQGTPIANASVFLLGKNGLPIVTGVTTTDGHFQLPSVEDFKDERQPTVYVVHHGDDISFIPYDRSDRQLNYSRFDTEGISDNTENSLSAFIFSDRGIYRPGDAMHLGMVVKQKFSSYQPPGLPLEAVITDPRGITVFNQKLTLPESGLLTLDYQLDSTALTGTYTANLYLIKKGERDNSIGDAEVRVEEFLPDRLKSRAQFLINETPVSSTTGWLSPNDLNAQLQVNNLYGTPALNRRVKAKILLAPQALNFPQYRHYVFIDPLLDPKKPPKVFSEDLIDTQTNDKGNAQFLLNLQRFSKATYQLTFFAEAFEADGGRGVSTQISTLITPLNYLIGYKSDSDLKYLKQNSQHNVNFIAINAKLQKIPVTHLSAQLFSVQTVATLVKNPNGTYSYQSIPQEKLLNEKAFAITKDGSDFNLPTDTIGDYALAIHDQDGNILSKLNFSVIGESAQAVSKNAELSVKLAKTDYKAGDVIEMQITAPYSGAGLISIERDKIYAYKWFKTDATNTVQNIQIPANFQGNGYINIAFVRSWDSDEIFISPLSYSVIPFSVSRAAQTVHITLGAPELVKPGDELAMQYSTDIPSKIIIFAVDQGILQVVDYQLPDPLEYFFRKRALAVNTSQIVDQILPKYINSREISAIGGDNAQKALANNLNPFKRKSEAPVVYWSGILDSDDTTRTLTYKVPDYFNGNIRVMAVAVAQNAVGSTQKDTTVRGDFVISPNVPMFVAPGDQFVVSANIANNKKGSGNNAATKISLVASNGLTINGSTQQSIVIPEGQEKAVQFTVIAGQALGNASLEFHVEQDVSKAQYSATLSIRPASAYQTTLITGSDSSAIKNIMLTRKLYSQYREQQALASNNPLILAQGLQGYLQAYPYNCTEQLVSTALAQLAIGQQPLFSQDPQQIQKALTNMYQMLRQRINNNGGFSYWPSQEDNDSGKFSTIYAMDFLTNARLLGYVVPQDLLDTGIYYLQNALQKDPKDLEEARLHAYAIYVLTRNEIVTTTYLTNLQLYLTTQNDTWKNNLTSVYLASTYQLLKNNEEAERLISGYSLEKRKQLTDEDFSNALADNAQYIALLARHFPEHLQKLGATPIIALTQSLSSHQLNTLSAAYSATALSAYAKTVPISGATQLKISEILSDKTSKPLSSSSEYYQSVQFGDEAQGISFINPDKQLYFYQIRQSGFNTTHSASAVNNGIEAYREYRNEKGETITQTNLGADIESRLRIRSLTNTSLSHVAIVDLLPGGFDVIQTSIKKADCDYVDVREDRVIFYCPIGTNVSEISYHLRAVNKGVYSIPPIMAQDMYNEGIQSAGVTGKIEVQ